MREVKATVLENTRIAEEIYSLTFSTDEKIEVRPGQFCMIGLAGMPLRRPIAICKAEGERITVCYRLKGAGTRFLAENYKKGEKLNVLLPLGNGFFVKKEEKRIAIVGGGVGIFPLISAIRAYEKDKFIASYMGFRNKDALCMQYEMERSDILKIASDDGSLGYHGTAVDAFIEDFDNAKPDVVLSCGPVPMLRALKKKMEGKGVPLYVSLEERMGCGIGACLVCVCNKTNGEHARVCKDGPVFNADEIDF
ncbi:MAG: dihydroorotate dehydrogenase electron transfer subunit [Clostridia bacterium]|nr:dihydroorotate dehydrogenase electron transfer subunit [Clostridia bacterium]